MNTIESDRLLDTNYAIEELRGAYWYTINVRDLMRHHSNPRPNLMAFEIHKAADILGDLLMRYMELDDCQCPEGWDTSSGYHDGDVCSK